MKQFRPHIRRSLSAKLSLGIVLFVVTLFIMALGYLFMRSRQIVRHEAILRVERILDNTCHRVNYYLEEIETATHNMEWRIVNNMQPDSLLAYTHSIVTLNPNINGCSITTEPDFFPQYGRYFSAYSVRIGDKVETVREAKYEYFDKVWYKMPRAKGSAIWVDPFDDSNAGTLSSPDMIASYCVPLTINSKFAGVISTDLSLNRLSQVISAEKPYPHSYNVMLGRDGYFFVHPDTTKLFNQTIFSGTDASKQPDIIALGHEMLAGKTGSLKVELNGTPCLVFYQPLAKTGWSIALVCTEDDIFSSSHSLIYIILPLLCVGLLLLLFFCHKTVAHFIEPIDTLVRQCNHIAEGNPGSPLPLSTRPDVIGRLQNNFVTMQQSLNEHIGHLQKVNEETEQGNQDLFQANELVKESDRQKTTFLQDMAHQIRTPLNIVYGFTQVLHNDYNALPPKEVECITGTMQQNASAIKRMINMLIIASSNKTQTSVNLSDEVSCVAIAKEAIKASNEDMPGLSEPELVLSVPERLTIYTKKEYLRTILRELLNNAKKFAGNQKITLKIEDTGTYVRFMVEDRGPGIDKTEHERIFRRFVKLNPFSDGLGLGLTISKSFAQLLGGDLTIDKSYKQGARFILKLYK